MLFSFSSVEGICFVENRRSAMEALDRDGAPLSLRDIQLLESEITKARQYLEQAQKLRAASHRCGEGLPDYDDGLPRPDTVCTYAGIQRRHITLI